MWRHATYTNGKWQQGSHGSRLGRTNLHTITVSGVVVHYTESENEHAIMLARIIAEVSNANRNTTKTD